MPVAAFPGDRNWGYDGVDLYAPHDAYGGPDGLERLVDACHAHGLARDPGRRLQPPRPGGELPRATTGPTSPTATARPWGDALNFDGPDSDEVRRFFVDNALLLARASTTSTGCASTRSRASTTSRRGPSCRSSPTRFTRRRRGSGAAGLADRRERSQRPARDPARRRSAAYGLDAQWSDDFHHALHALLTGNAARLLRRLRARRRPGEGDHRRASSTTANTRRIGAGGTARPRRPTPAIASWRSSRTTIRSPTRTRDAGSRRWRGSARQKVAAAVLFSTPALPLLFQGEEWAEEAPFDYFTSHGDPALAEAVRSGRHAEYLHLLDEGADAGDVGRSAGGGDVPALQAALDSLARRAARRGCWPSTGR